MKKKLVLALLAAAAVSAAAAGCGRNPEENNNTGSTAGTTSAAKTGKVYYLNFKPEVEDKWKKIAKVYQDETGTQVQVLTAASGTYEEVLKAEIAKSDAVTLFQINGPVGYASWKDYCADLSGTDIYNALTDKEMAITGADGGVYGIPYAVESYGIIYNNAIMEKYFNMDGAKASSMDEINNFETLKAVVEDMQAKKEELGIEGVFASTSLASGEDWRWHTHLANIPVSYELKDKNVNDVTELTFTYSENMKNIFDLYIQNSCTAPGLLGDRSVTDSMAEFALGQVAMVQNGNWAWGQISDVDGNVVAESDIKFLPVYTGMEGEENQGLCIGTENFWAVNSQASPENQKASIDFMNWLISSEKGKSYMVNDLGIVSPFTTFSAAERPQDPLAQEMFRYMESDKTSIPWNFTIFPSQQFKNDFGAALLEYAGGGMPWENVRNLVVTRWADEKTATAP